MVRRADHPTKLVGPAAPVRQPASTVGGSWSALGPRPENTAYLYTAGTARDQSVGLVSGRATSLVVDPTNSATVYVGTMGGGVWKSTDGGQNWAPKTDSQASLAIGSLAIDQTGQVIYAGTGEGDGGTSQYGQGILKSTDGGNTWTLLGQATFAGKHVASIAVDRTTSGATQRVLAATDSGLYISQDGGATWTRNTNILSATLRYSSTSTPNGGITEIIQDPTTPTRFWASLSDFCRKTEGGNIAVSDDSGATWKDVNDFSGLPVASRIGLGVGAGGVAYAAFADCSSTTSTTGALGDIEKTTDGGTSWISLAGSAGYTNYFNYPGDTGPGQGDYDNVVAVDPSNASRAVFGGISMLATSNGGASFTQVARPTNCGSTSQTLCPIHVDQHALAFSGPNSFYAGNDGGVWKTADLGGTGTTSDWSDLNATLTTTEFYQGTANTLTHPFGGAQDNGSSGNLPGDAALPTFFAYVGGDGGFTAVTPDASTAYGEYEYLGMQQVNAATAAVTSATPCDKYTADSNGNEQCQVGTNVDYVNFIAPFVMDPANPTHLLAGTSRVYETTDGGVPKGSSSWHAISPNLTTGDTDKLATIAIDPAGGTNTIITGSQFGAVWLTTNGGASWTDITGNLPTATASNYLFPNPFVGSIVFNPSNPAEVWVTNGGVGVGHVWHTTNAGAAGGTTWTDISGSGATGVPNAPAFGLLLDPNDANTIYVGTYYGARVCTTCGGANASPNWSQLGTGLPNAAVGSLTLTSDDANIVAWTHGRGAWTMARPTAAAAPVAATGTATNIGSSSATLNGTVNPNGGSTSYRFDYGTTTAYGSSTAAADAGSGSSPVSESSDVSGLSANTTYHYRIVALRNGSAVAFGADQTFATAAPATPTVATGSAANVASSSATLKGTINPQGSPASYRFDYGTTTSYGSSTAAADAGSGTSDVAATAQITSLSASTTYHFRIVALRGSTAVAFGADQTFTTAPEPPTATTGSADSIGQSTARLHGDVNPNGSPSSYRFDYGTSTSYGSSTPAGDAGSGTADVPVDADLSGLSAGTVYHFRVVALRGGTVAAYGGDQTFTTNPPPAPSVQTQDAQSVTPNGATVTGTVNPHGTATSYRFDYGPTVTYGTSTPTGNAGSTTIDTPVAFDLTGLRPASEYHYRLVALRGGSVAAYGADKTFTTLPIPVQAKHPPVNTSAPAIMGTPTPGATLTCTPGGWTGATYFSYEWWRETTPIAGGSSYRPGVSDLDHLLSCSVTAHNSDGSTSAVSSPVRITDHAPPVVRAMPSRGRRSHSIRLRYHVTDNSGITRDTITIYRGSGVRKRFRTQFGPASWTTNYYVAWRPPRTGTGFRFCVQSVDPSGNRSNRSCAAITLRG